MAKTNPEEWRVALSIVAHGEIVWLWPQDLHNVLIELCLFFLYRERADMLGLSLNCLLMTKLSWVGVGVGGV